MTVRFEPSEEGTHTCSVATGVASCGGISCTGDAQYAWETIYTSGYHFWNDIWGSSAADIWVVGGEMRHYNGSVWSEVTNPSDKSLYGVWGNGPIMSMPSGTITSPARGSSSITTDPPGALSWTNFQ